MMLPATEHVASPVATLGSGSSFYGGCSVPVIQSHYKWRISAVVKNKARLHLAE
ncbi:hypothetical protein I5907_13000 [Panacibacter sp. DH6]|uniref:Uncharacterized protein n=1 Tax=Panacibacter microcysteis TaxID=2793269 RepID=A0A931EAD9_9BACT|nr:hypothetical protein [Panacibacter microcysteis]MBG9377154.1 hypothetical protein [Panacibacter microcysteis]